MRADFGVQAGVVLTGKLLRGSCMHQGCIVMHSDANQATRAPVSSSKITTKPITWHYERPPVSSPLIRIGLGRTSPSERAHCVRRAIGFAGGVRASANRGNCTCVCHRRVFIRKSTANFGVTQALPASDFPYCRPCHHKALELTISFFPSRLFLQEFFGLRISP